MTKKQRLIQEARNSIKEVQSKIELHRKEIERLEEKIKNLEQLPDFTWEDRLYNISDFPGVCDQKPGLIYLAGRGNICTVRDLINSSKEEILGIKGIGPIYYQRVKEWMDKHGLKFV